MLTRILVIDDDKVINKMLSDILKQEGYDVISAYDGISGLESIYQSEPSLILLDVVLPGMDGYQLCRLIKNDTRASHVPIILLTSLSNTNDKVEGLESGAEDYITKPFDPLELIARVKLHLRKAKQVRSFNPLTGLPGNIVIEEKIKSIIETFHEFAVLYVDLDNFKAYNDVYGFMRGDEVLKLLAHLLQKTVQNHGNIDDFIGHIGGDDFIIITTPDRIEIICENIISKFDDAIRLAYSYEDRRQGYFISKDRSGKEQKFPLMTISIAVVSNKHLPIKSTWQISELAAKVKKEAKAIHGSTYVELKAANI